MERLDTVGETVEARARPRVGSADAVVGDADEDPPVVAQHAHGDWEACACLATLVIASAMR